MAGPIRPPGFGDPRPHPTESEAKYTLPGAYDKARRILDADAIKEYEFADLYGRENVARDTTRAARAKEQQHRTDTPEERESAKLATVLEAVVHTQINSGQWFGRYAKSLRSSKYDDLVNGVDDIVEFKLPQIPMNHLALGVDITYGANVAKKFRRIKDEIDLGQLATIKYLRSSDGTSRGEKTHIPRLVVAVDGQTCVALAKAWFENAPGIKTSPVRYQIIKELYTQLVVFESYARKAGQVLVADKYKESLGIVGPLFRDMEKQYAAFKYEVKDRSADGFEAALAEFR